MSIIRKAFFGSQSKPIVIDYNRLLQNNPVVFYNYDQEDFIEKGYSSNAEVYKIVKKITDKCAIAEPWLYIDNGNVKALKYRKFRTSSDPVQHIKKNLYVAKTLDFAPETDTLSKLLKQPNQYQSWREMMELFRIFYFVQGEAFLIRETDDNSDVAIEINVAPANWMHHKMGADGQISEWILDLGNGNTRTFEGDDINQVFQLKMANPNYDPSGSHLRGMSPLMAGLKYLQLDDSSIEAWVKTMQNEGAKGILSPNHNNIEQWLTPEQQKQTEKAVDNKIHGAKNKNRVVVSAMPLQYTQIGMSPDAMNIIQGMNSAEAKLCDLWGVPPVLFNPEPTYANQPVAAKRFINDVILPYLNKEEDALNRWLVEPFAKAEGKKYIIDYDTSLFDELKPSLDEIDALLKTSPINEVRIMLGYDEYEVGNDNPANQLFISQGLVPIDDFSGDFRDTFN